MAEALRFELVSPERLLLSEEMDMVTIPGADGEFGVMARHIPLIATLRSGVIRCWKDQQVVRTIFVAGGFAEVTQDRCTVLAEEAIAVADLDATALTRELADCREDIERSKDEASRKRLGGRLKLLEAKQAAATGRFAA